MSPTRLAALAWAGAFAVAFVAGLIPNPLVGSDGFFKTNLAHDLFHVVTAVAFVVFAYRPPTATRRFLLGFGAVYVGLGLLGFAVTGTGGEMGMLFGVICVNVPDNLLHVTLGLGILATGRALTAADDDAPEAAVPAS